MHLWKSTNVSKSKIFSDPTQGITMLLFVKDPQMSSSLQSYKKQQARGEKAGLTKSFQSLYYYQDSEYQETICHTQIRLNVKQGCVACIFLL